MPPAVGVAIAIGGVIGTATGIFGLAVGGLAAFAAGAALSGGLALVSHLLAPSVSIPDLASTTGATRGTTRSAVPEPRWVLGRARVGGQMIYYEEQNDPAEAHNLDGEIAHYILALAVAPIEDVETIWVDGEELRTPHGTPIVRHPNGTDGSVFRYFVVQSSAFNAQELQIVISLDGGRDNVRNVLFGTYAASAPPGLDPDTHRLEGVVWAHVRLRQTTYGDDPDLRAWTQLPNIEFLLKGQKITWPGNAVPKWTENAAAIYYWLLRERAGIPEGALDLDSFRAAISVSGQEVDVGSLPAAYAGFPSAGIRYSCNGVITGTDDLSRIRDELDFCLQGGLVEKGGIIHLRAGAPGVSVGTIDAENIAEASSFRPAPAISERVNALDMKLASSAQHGWVETRMPEFNDTDAQSRDGRKFARDIGTRAFVSDSVTAGRLMAILLRRARATKRMIYRITPSADLREYSWTPGDIITVNDPVHGLDQMRAAVVRIRRLPDWSVEVELNEEPLNLYNSTLVLPSLPRVGLPVPTVPSPMGLMASLTRNLVSLSWDTLEFVDGYRLQVVALTTMNGMEVESPDIYEVELDYSSVTITTGPNTPFTMPALGRYRANLWGRFGSVLSTSPATTIYEVQELLPDVLTAEVDGMTVLLLWSRSGPTDRRYEVRIVAITADGTEDAAAYDATTNTTATFAERELPATGRYKAVVTTVLSVLLGGSIVLAPGRVEETTFEIV